MFVNTSNPSQSSSPNPTNSSLPIAKRTKNLLSTMLPLLHISNLSQNPKQSYRKLLKNSKPSLSFSQMHTYPSPKEQELNPSTYPTPSTHSPYQSPSKSQDTLSQILKILY